MKEHQMSRANTSLFAKLAGLGALALLLGTGPSAEAAQGPQPNICVRSCWGARAPRANCIANMATLNRAVIHHTAGSEYASTGLESSKSYMRSIQNYHIDSRGWCDIAYHFLVDKHGNIFEGRWNAWAGLPQGSHDGVNINSFGFTWMGWFHPDKPGGGDVPTVAMRNSMYDVIAWRMPSSWSPYGGGTYNARSCGWLTTHRDTNPTACPGDLAYGYIGANQNAGEARDGVNSRKNGTPPPPPATNPPFYFNANSEGWTPGAGICCGIAWNGSGWPGVIYMDQNNTDAGILSPTTSFTGAANALLNVMVYPQNGTTANHDMQLFYKTGSEQYFDAPKSSGIVSYNRQNNWINLNLDVNSPKWAGQIITGLRLDFDNANSGTRWIVNHAILQSSLRWYFDSNAMNWTAGPGICCGIGWQNGSIFFDQNGNDASIYADPAWFTLAGPLNYLGAANDTIHVRIYPEGGTTANHDMQVYWISAFDTTWSESKSTYVTYTGQNAWVDVYIPVGGNANWVDKQIKQIRVDFDNVNHGNRWHIDYIMTRH